MTPLILSRGDVVLARFPFTDLTGTSVRSALVVSPGQIGQDIILVAISSVLRGGSVPTDYTVDMTHPEFAMTGLRVTSVFRVHKLATVERSVIVRRLGRIGPQLQAQVERLLRTVLAL
ncbi:type II toxin-antitoxin system PemK/MazF family toxin [Candidatus Poribacteria bacterium]|nr:type II toxin-antitoxin system PemK/MazF family toxin [Candidatus Poribacteria bacterium]